MKAKLLVVDRCVARDTPQTVECDFRSSPVLPQTDQTGDTAVETPAEDSGGEGAAVEDAVEDDSGPKVLPSCRQELACNYKPCQEPRLSWQPLPNTKLAKAFASRIWRNP